MSNAAENSQALPYGVGRLSTGWLILVAMVGIVVLCGLYAWAGQIIHGKVVNGARDIGQMGGAAWGIYIAMMLFALGVGFVGIAVVALSYVFKFRQFRHVGRIAEVLSLSAIIVGLLSILADLGQPFRAFSSLLQYARPQSPFYGTMLLALTYLMGVVVFIYLDGRRDAWLLSQRQSKLGWLYRAWATGYRNTPAQRARHGQVTFWMGVAMLTLVFLYHTTLGLVFGLTAARPVWSTGLLPIWHFALNVISGLGGVLVLIAALLRATLGLREQLNMELFRTLANILMVTMPVLLLVVYIEVVTGFYSGNPVLMGVLNENFAGRFAVLTWATILMMMVAFLLLAWQFLRGHTLGKIVVSALLVTGATFLQRYVVVVSSQTHGNSLPYGIGNYSPSGTELMIVAGFVGIGALFYLGFMKVFPIMSLTEDNEAAPSEAPKPATRNRTRMIAVLALVCVGLLIQAVAYFLLGAAWGFPPSSEAYSNPTVPFAPVIYLSGVAITFSAAIVYELWPDPSPGDEPAATVPPGADVVADG